MQTLQDISFTAKQGEITALVGPSEGGKSTLSKLATCFWDIPSGKITLADQSRNLTSVLFHRLSGCAPL